VLGILEIAESQAESFRDWGTSHIVDAQQKPRIQHVRDLLTLMIAEVLAAKVPGVGACHRKLLGKLGSSLKRTGFISLNYDILIDNALADLYTRWDLDYSVDFTNYAAGTWSRPRPSKRVGLFKLHGSLNWLYCPTCRTLELTPKEGKICSLKWEPSKCLCPRCGTLAVPIIIPPTYFKALSNLYLREIWHAAERELSECDRIVFCGYSFPDPVRWSVVMSGSAHRQIPTSWWSTHVSTSRVAVAVGGTQGGRGLLSHPTSRADARTKTRMRATGFMGSPMVKSAVRSCDD
jgi:hypothetical protein